jgi:hypothetical protein
MWVIGRRATFFFCVSLVSVALVLPCPPPFRWVAWFCAGLAAFWGILLAADRLSAARSSSRPK